MADPDLSGTVLDGRYQVIAPIAEGAMGSVYRGERLQLGRAVAIKVMHEALPDELSSRQRFEREAKLMALLEHPHCVSVIDFGVHDDKPFLVMELVRGTSLLELIEKHGRLEAPRAAEILRQILSGLAHAHELGIVHRDVKPANVMVTEKTGLGEQVRILDFGLARLAEQSTKLTTGIALGTPNYMAPEQIKGGDLDARTDLYACGVMLFEMLTGKKPFSADDPIAVVRKHLHDPPPRLADVAPGGDFRRLEPVVARALAKAPGDRYASAVEMSAAIEAAVVPRPTTAPIAEVYARAVPQNAPSPGPQVATPSGWSVPADLVEPPSGATTGAIAEPVASAASAPASASSAPTRVLEQVQTGPSHVAPDPAYTGRTSIALGAVPPPARPPAAASSGARPTLPLSRRQLLIGGGSLLGLVLLIGIIAAGRSPASRAAAADGGTGTAVASDAGGDPLAPLVARANDLYYAGDLDGGIDLLRKARRQYPDSAELAFWSGKLYFAKLWFTDGVKSFRDAIRLDPAYGGDPELIKIVLRGFNTTPDVDDRLAGFLHDDIGQAAVPYLQETAQSHPNKAIRDRASAELRRYR